MRRPWGNRLLRATREEYEAVRAEASRFLMAAGQENPAVDRVLEENALFAVIEKKKGPARQLDRATDPHR